MFGFIKKMFHGLLTSIINAPNHTKYIYLNNQQCTNQPTHINLHPNESTQGLCYYPFAVTLDRYTGSCNTLNDLSNRVCVPNKTEDLDLSIFNMIAGISDLKILTKHVSCKCKCKFDGKICNSNQKWNYEKCWCDCKKPREQDVCKKDYICNSATL